jgi:hypothetical protein
MYSCVPIPGQALNEPSNQLALDRAASLRRLGIPHVLLLTFFHSSHSPAHHHSASTRNSSA